MGYKKKYDKKQIISVALGVVILAGCLAGCGNAGVSGDGQDGVQTGTNDAGTQQYAEGTAMGRYVEKTLELADGVRLSGNGNRLFKLDNGQMIITDSMNPFVISKDGGMNWYEDKRDWNNRMLECGDYIISAAVGGDNTVAVIYQTMNTGVEESDSEAQGGAAEVDTEEESSSEMQDEAAGDGAEEDSESEAQDKTVSADGKEASDPQLLIIKPDKTEIPVEMKLTEEDERLKGVYISESGRILVTTHSANIYEVMEDGTSKLFLETEEGSPDLIQFHGELMFADGWDYPSLLIYDMERKEYIEDEVLESFIEENYADRTGFSGNWYDMFFFLDQESVLYIAGEKGVYRHVIGGSAMEQIIDGNLSIFGNPSYALEGMIALENNEFLALFSGEMLVRFTYNQDIPSVPVVRLQAYSLEDNETIRQAINQYQTENPEIYVDLEIGMGGDNSVMREDALKSLNTRIMAGEGPDIFVLDDMPIDSYIEKGVLQDMSPMFQSMSGEDELFGNIVDAFRTEDKIYMLPCEIQLPAVVGRKSELTEITDLEKTADAVEQMREAHPEEDLFRLCTQRGVMRLFSTVSAPVWMREDNTVDREMISEFLIQTKRIYDAQMDGLSDRVLDEYEEWNRFSEEEFGAPWDETDVMRTSMNGIRLVGGMMPAGWGAISGVYAYAEYISVPRAQGYEDYEWLPIQGQCEDAFTAKTLMGVSAATKQPEAAQDFVKGMFGKENQSSLYQGMPVNKAAFLAGFTLEEDIGADGAWGSLATINEDGTHTVFVVYCPDQSQVADLQAYMESVNTPYLENTVLEEAVYEEGIAYMQGRRGLDEALDAIEKKMAIYLAE